MDSQGWRQEAMQYRRNQAENEAQMREIMRMLEGLSPSLGDEPGFPLFCLAMHHFAMRFHNVAEKRTIKIMMKANVDDLPKAFGDFSLNTRVKA